MGNEDKVNDLIRISKDNFLPSEVVDTTPPMPEYSLESEIAKARKHRHGKFYFVIASFLVLVVGGSYLFTRHLQKDLSKNVLGFGDFEDLKLSEMLTSTRQEEKALNLAKDQLAVVEKDRQTKINAVRSAYAEKIEAIYAKQLPAAETKALVDDVKLAREKEIEAVESEFAVKIEDGQTNVAKKEKALDNKKLKLEEQVNKAESIVNNYKKLQQMQMQKLRDDHNRAMANVIIKYNPKFGESELRKIISEGKKRSDESFILFDYQHSLYNLGLITEGEFETMRVRLGEYQSLMERLQKVPYTNSVDPSLDIIDNSGAYLISQYERLVNALAIELEQYSAAIEYITEKSADGGIVIDAGNPSNVKVSMKIMVDLTPGDTGLIFRRSDQFIGTIIFEEKYGELRARVLEINPGQKIQPFDKIYLQKARAEAMEEPEMGLDELPGEGAEGETGLLEEAPEVDQEMREGEEGSAEAPGEEDSQEDSQEDSSDENAIIPKEEDLPDAPTMENGDSAEVPAEGGEEEMGEMDASGDGAGEGSGPENGEVQ